MARFIATAYGPPWGGIEGGGTTSTGIDLHAHPHVPVIAVDPSVIPYGTLVHACPNPFGDCNITFIAGDTGGAIQGNRIDFYDPRGRAHQNAWGRRGTNITIVGHVAKSNIVNAAFKLPTPLDPFGPIDPFGGPGAPSLPFNAPNIPGVPDLSGGGLDRIAGAIETIANAMKGFFDLITSLDFWIRAGEAVAGFILLYMGLHALTGAGPSARGAARGAGTIARDAALAAVVK